MFVCVRACACYSYMLIIYYIYPRLRTEKVSYLWDVHYPACINQPQQSLKESSYYHWLLFCPDNLFQGLLSSQLKRSKPAQLQRCIAVFYVYSDNILPLQLKKLIAENKKTMIIRILGKRSLRISCQPKPQRKTRRDSIRSRAIISIKL